MPKILEELWYGQIDPIEFFGKNNADLKISEIKAIEKIESLAAVIGEAEAEKLQELVNDYFMLATAQAFADGFSLCTKLTAEALLNADNCIIPNK